MTTAKVNEGSGAHKIGGSFITRIAYKKRIEQFQSCAVIGCSGSNYQVTDGLCKQLACSCYCNVVNEIHVCTSAKDEYSLVYKVFRVNRHGVVSL